MFLGHDDLRDANVTPVDYGWKDYNSTVPQQIAPVQIRSSHVTAAMTFATVEAVGYANDALTDGHGLAYFATAVACGAINYAMQRTVEKTDRLPEQTPFDQKCVTLERMITAGSYILAAGAAVAGALFPEKRHMMDAFDTGVAAIVLNNIATGSRMVLGLPTPSKKTGSCDI